MPPKVVKEELKNEAKERLDASKGKPKSIEDFLVAKKKSEEEQRQVLSSDLEIIKDVSPAQLLELQGLDVKGRPTGKPSRLYGWDPQTKTACVLKEAYLAEVKNK